MPVPKKKTTTSPTSTQAPSMVNSAPPLKLENFHQYLRTEIRHATRLVMEEIMCEELSSFLGAKWGECTLSRNGFYSRDLMTTSGPIDDLQVPRDREGAFHTQAFEHDSRYEPQIAEGVTHMFVAGTSTRYPWGKSLKHSWAWLPVLAASAV